MLHVCTMQGDFFFRDEDFENKALLMRFIQERRAIYPLDEIWISGEEDDPCITLLLHGSDACVTYFADDACDMWISQGDSDREAVFLAGGVEWDAPADTVVTCEAALAAVEEFCDTRSRPTCLMWQVL